MLGSDALLSLGSKYIRMRDEFKPDHDSPCKKGVSCIIGQTGHSSSLSSIVSSLSYAFEERGKQAREKGIPEAERQHQGSTTSAWAAQGGSTLGQHLGALHLIYLACGHKWSEFVKVFCRRTTEASI